MKWGRRREHTARHRSRKTVITPNNLIIIIICIIIMSSVNRVRVRHVKAYNLSVLFFINFYEMYMMEIWYEYIGWFVSVRTDRGDGLRRCGAKITMLRYSLCPSKYQCIIYESRCIDDAVVFNVYRYVILARDGRETILASHIEQTTTSYESWHRLTLISL